MPTLATASRSCVACTRCATVSPSTSTPPSRYAGGASGRASPWPCTRRGSPPPPRPPGSARGRPTEGSSPCSTRFTGCSSDFRRRRPWRCSSVTSSPPSRFRRVLPRAARRRDRPRRRRPKSAARDHRCRRAQQHALRRLTDAVDAPIADRHELELELLAELLARPDADLVRRRYFEFSGPDLFRAGVDLGPRRRGGHRKDGRDDRRGLGRRRDPDHCRRSHAGARRRGRWRRRRRAGPYGHAWPAAGEPGREPLVAGPGPRRAPRRPWRGGGGRRGRGRQARRARPGPCRGSVRLAGHDELGAADRLARSGHRARPLRVPGRGGAGRRAVTA